MLVWTWLIPAVSVVLLVITSGAGIGAMLAVLCGVGLIGAVIAAVHHAEVVAHRVGEPFGTLVLAVMMQGAVHLVIFAAFLFLAIVP